ncbi:DUF1223 domain-containing protein [Lentibacter sp. XHP0401]|jgi:hypothetical protein|uniref:DUF1223 domain-containing protein n=1 Tax=Lentibacter sp. XHP0401 TaxID=2984334 RepID=UPI0021E903FA|nr:DUF1223 domain-containing protein [Lentibacter sp. XHP0401]MCV2891674.1 DUF1223 domain-containing protein [Lentibacter sp. XHP0401]
MWRSIALALLMLSGIAAQADAQERKLIVVELFTSQSCSSCPPADAFLHELAGRNDVLALGLHVDYWDYIGWKDTFGQHAFSERQRAYAKVGGRRSVYTPQMIVNGEQHVVGNHPKEVNALIKLHQSQPERARIEVRRDGGRVQIAAQAEGNGQAAVLLVSYMSNGVANIHKGENEGKELNYANIVTDIKVLEIWDMKRPLELSARAPDAENLAVVLQSRGHGPILAAARVK